MVGSASAPSALKAHAEGMTGVVRVRYRRHLSGVTLRGSRGVLLRGFRVADPGSLTRSQSEHQTADGAEQAGKRGRHVGRPLDPLQWTVATLPRASPRDHLIECGHVPAARRAASDRQGLELPPEAVEHCRPLLVALQEDGRARDAPGQVASLIAGLGLGAVLHTLEAAENELRNGFPGLRGASEGRVGRQHLQIGVQAGRRGT